MARIAPDRPARHSAATRPPLVRQTLAGAVVAAIRERILDGTYPAGMPLRQEMLAAELDVSRIPVREALRQLVAEGLATGEPHRGVVVSGASVREIEELFELRAGLESDLLRRAVPHLTSDELERAADALARFDTMLRAGEIAAWGDLNWRFHSTLYRAAGRPVTLDTVERLHRQAERYMRMQLALTDGASRAMAEHHAILAACRRRNAARAATLVDAHIRAAGRALSQYLVAREAASENAGAGDRA